ncbi:hypothetical protein FOQG_15885 [Fusarium oxysporum f. sp. raphani 54005]|uniref:Uncharacterized protein n=2 Tax=Fusarium oxysporum f. sp. raphani TaxID=96318 RepID=X0BLY4_FUSOX|nr:hypothetical protein FOQG_15885 [Fusarium oxysporum f. sp. raphani 54005]KAG7411587.1 hypothetical protein Forpi1262_v017499 [Fusarium oxysporum f. sp. raphani]
MPLSHPYVVWKARPVEWNMSEARGGDLRSPRGTLSFVGGNGCHKIEINVRSRDTMDHLLIFWTGKLTNETQFGHRIVQALENIGGFSYHQNPPRLDFFRDGFLNIRAGTIHDTNVEGPKNDITDDLDAFFQADLADFERSTLFVWGELIGHGSIHQVHLNQGNYPETAIGTYFFIAFAGQAFETDNNGNLASGDATAMLRDFINAPPPVTPTIPVTPGQASGLWIHSTLVNPEAYLANNRDGVIVLKAVEGAEVHRVSYSSNVPSGRWIFGPTRSSL